MHVGVRIPFLLSPVLSILHFDSATPPTGVPARECGESAPCHSWCTCNDYREDFFGLVCWQVEFASLEFRRTAVTLQRLSFACAIFIDDSGPSVRQGIAL